MSRPAAHAPPLAVVASAAHVLAHAPGPERIAALCGYLKEALPAAQVRFRSGTRRTDDFDRPAADDQLISVAVPAPSLRDAAIEVSAPARDAVEVRGILDAVAAVLAALLPPDGEPVGDELTRLHGLTIDSLPLGIYVVDRDYRIVLWNRKRETGTQGLRRGDVIGQRVFDVLRRQPPELLRTEFDAVFTTGTVRVSEQEVHANHDVRIFRTSRLPMRLGGDVVSHVITIGEDVTENRTMQRTMHQAEKLAAIGQLAAGVMHEINNPLATIGGCVAAIAAVLGDSAPASVTEYLGMVESEIARCDAIIGGLLDFSRSARNVPTVASVDVSAMLERTLALVKHHQRFRRLRVTEDLVTPSPVVHGNEERLIQAVMAILLNAADATGGYGNVAVRTRESGGNVCIDIEDDGPGIPADVLPRIFDPFFTTKGPSRGTGLGLAICYGIISDHHGTIRVSSEPGRTIVHISLPGNAGVTA